MPLFYLYDSLYIVHSNKLLNELKNETIKLCNSFYTNKTFWKDIMRALCPVLLQISIKVDLTTYVT